MKPVFLSRFENVALSVFYSVHLFAIIGGIRVGESNEIFEKSRFRGLLLEPCVLFPELWKRFCVLFGRWQGRLFQWQPDPG